MSSYRRRYSKRELLGSLHVDYIMSLSDLGLVPGTNRWDVLRAFLNRGEARAERLLEDQDGFLILQSIPGRRNTGAIYVYTESLGAFFWLTFGEREDDLSGEDFQNALRVHRLVRFVAEKPKRKRRSRRRWRPTELDPSRVNIAIPLFSSASVVQFVGQSQRI